MNHAAWLGGFLCSILSLEAFMQSPAILWLIVGLTIVTVIAFVAMATTMTAQASGPPRARADRGDDESDGIALAKLAELKAAERAVAEPPPPANVAGF
jgi:hypothetical protein